MINGSITDSFGSFDVNSLSKLVTSSREVYKKHINKYAVVKITVEMIDGWP